MFSFEDIVKVDPEVAKAMDKFAVKAYDPKAIDTFKRELDDSNIELTDNETISITKEKSFDLALRKFITNVNGQEETSRIPQVKYVVRKICFPFNRSVFEVKHYPVFLRYLSWN